MNFQTGDETYDRRIAALLPRFSQTTRATALDYLKVRSLTLRPSTLYSYAHLLCILDDHLNGRPYRQITRDYILSFLLSERQRVSLASVVTRTRCLKRFLKDQIGHLAPDLEAVLRTRDPPPPDKANVLTKEQFNALLTACTHIEGPRSFDRVTHAQGHHGSPGQFCLSAYWNFKYSDCNGYAVEWRRDFFALSHWHYSSRYLDAP